MYTFRIRKTYVRMSTQCVHGVQRINAVKGVNIRVQSYSNEMHWDGYTSEYHPHDINPVICWNFHNMLYIPDVYLVKCRISGQHVPVCHIPVKFQGDAMFISYVYRLHTPKRKLENKGGNKQSHSNDHIMRYLNEWHTCTLKCRVHHGLSVCVYARTSFAHNLGTR